jgi:hypothetical protein
MTRAKSPPTRVVRVRPRWAINEVKKLYKRYPLVHRCTKSGVRLTAHTEAAPHVAVPILIIHRIFPARFIPVYSLTPGETQRKAYSECTSWALQLIKATTQSDDLPAGTTSEALTSTTNELELQCALPLDRSLALTLWVQCRHQLERLARTRGRKGKDARLSVRPVCPTSIQCGGLLRLKFLKCSPCFRLLHQLRLESGISNSHDPIVILVTHS